MTTFDLTELSDIELRGLQDAVTAEVQRRTIPATMETLNRAYLVGSGAAEGEPWRQPQGAHDAYPLGWVVAHRDALWESLVAGNVWEPGVSGWRQKVGDDEWPAWVQPSGSHDAYQRGDRVSHNDSRWTSDADGNVWEPGVFGWTESTD